MSICSSDLYALFLSFCSMKDQIRGSVVSKSWKQLVDFHSSLLNIVDLTDSILKYQKKIVKQLLKLGGARVRVLHISTPILYIHGAFMHGVREPCSFLQGLPNLMRIVMFGDLEFICLKEITNAIASGNHHNLDLHFVSYSCRIPYLITELQRRCVSIARISSPKRLGLCMTNCYACRSNNEHALISYCHHCKQDFVKNPPQNFRCPLCSKWLSPLQSGDLCGKKSTRFIKNHEGYRLRTKTI